MILGGLTRPNAAEIVAAAHAVSAITAIHGGAVLHTDCNGSLGTTRPGSNIGDWFPLGHVRGDTHDQAESSIRELLDTYFEHWSVEPRED